MSKTILLAVLSLVLAVAGCKSDKALHDYNRCMEIDANGKGDVSEAWSWCHSASVVDPDTTSGKAAAAWLAANQARYDKVKAAEAASAAVAASAAALAAQAQQAAIANVTRKYTSEQPDEDCQSEGKPAYLWDYSGGTAQQNAAAAHRDGCKHYMKDDPTLFCCPTKPRTF